MPTVSIQGLELHYLKEGESGPAIVLLHGITDCLESYRPVIAKLRETGQVFALDFRGHGKSARGTLPYRLEHYVQDAEGFLLNVVGEPAFVAGHSLGGLVGSWIGARGRVPLRGLLLEDPPLWQGQHPAIESTSFFPLFTTIQAVLRGHHASSGSLESLAQMLGGLPNDPVGGQGPSMLEALGEEGVQRRAFAMHHFDPDALDAALQGDLFGAFDPDRMLGSVACPTRLLAGNASLGGAMHADDVKRAADLIPNTTTETWDDTGHLLHTDHPDRFARAVAHFVERASA